MSAKKSQGMFTANVKVVVIVGVAVAGRSIEEAVANAGELDFDDCVKCLGEQVDSTTEVVGVSSDHWVD